MVIFSSCYFHVKHLWSKNTKAKRPIFPFYNFHQSKNNTCLELKCAVTNLSVAAIRLCVFVLFVFWILCFLCSQRCRVVTVPRLDGDAECLQVDWYRQRQLVMYLYWYLNILSITSVRLRFDENTSISIKMCIEENWKANWCCFFKNYESWNHCENKKSQNFPIPKNQSGLLVHAVY